MAAINGVKKSAVVKKQKGKYGGGIIAITAVISVLLTVLAVALFWKLYYETKVKDTVILELQQGQYQAYKATRDISSGEYIDGAIEVVTVPSSLVTPNALSSGSDTSVLRASGNIAANTIITTQNTYDPEMQDAMLSSSRIVQIDYLKTPGADVGDYIDIRLKVYKDNDMDTYRDDRVCSKKEILSKDENGNIELMLSESEILNINSAVIEATNPDQDGSVYVTKYIDPANQPKAPVNYDGKGVSYTADELREAQNKLKENQDANKKAEDLKNDTDSVVEPVESGTPESVAPDASMSTSGSEVNDSQVPNTEGNEGD